MPLPADPAVVKTSQGLVDTLHGIFGPHPGFRPAHAKGILFTGTFTPTSTASSLSKAKHFTNASTPITVRFSNSTGIPQIPDTDANGDPRGFAIRFNLGLDANGRRSHTDIVAHSVPAFPGKDGEEALAFFKAVANSPPDAPHPNAIEQYLATHPAALAFIQIPKPTPESFATQHFFSVNAFKLIDADGKETFVRYTIEPVAGVKTLSAEELAGKEPNFLQDEIVERVKKGPVEYKLLAQIAEEGDVTDDNTQKWPDTRKVVELGSIKVEEVVPFDKQEAEQKYIIFDPIPRVEGVGPSADPLLDVRAGVYIISGKERRAA
jgi:catalase